MSVRLFKFGQIAAVAAATSLALILSASANAAEQNAVHTGETLFAKTGCQHCHGPAGIGGHLGPDLSNVGRKLKPHEIAKQIKLGGKAMPAFKGILNDRQISDLVQYLCSPRKTTSKPTIFPAQQPAGGN